MLEVAVQVDERRLGIAKREDGLDEGRPRQDRALASHERDRPVLAPALAGARLRRPADQIEVGDVSQIHDAGGRKRVPHPEPRIYLHQLELAVAGIALVFDLRDTGEVADLQQAQRVIDQLGYPERLAVPTATNAARYQLAAARSLAKLAPAEDAERAAFAIEVAAYS